jgi:DNA-binding SARP family transcriptional activator/tetratricopeptide (TPR) repeat protein
VEFGLLGPLTVRCDGDTVPVPPGKQRAVLAALLLKAGQVVTVAELAEVLWGAASPPSARVTVQNYVMRLRKSLAVTDRALITTEGHGYLVGADAGVLDVTTFETLIAAVHAAIRGNAWEAAGTKARSALSLWRGEPLTDVGSEVLEQREVPRLAELRLQVLEARIRADLQLGRHLEAISELQPLVTAHPMREQLHALLMLALYQSGRQSEALAGYRLARHLLIEELGVEPGPELRSLHQQILEADPALAVPGSATAARWAGDAAPSGADAAASGWYPGRAGTSLVPRQLPTGTPHFTGRHSELAVLSRALNERSRSAGTVVISAIGGMAGVGKTSLAVYWAHQVAAAFPDGQLYVNLHGFGPSADTVAPDRALRGFLAALGVPPLRIPADPQAQVGMYRSLLAGKQMLIVLDNAHDENQVRPLLPASPACLVLVTSRNQLTGLVAGEGAELVSLGVLSDAEARDLLGRRLGSQRVKAEPDVVTELASLCARLPLALAVTAARAAASGFSLTALAAELRDEHARLEVLTAGDPVTSVAAVFSWSYRYLKPAAARMFRLLSLHPGADASTHAAAGLAATPLDEARGLLHELVRANLLAESVPGRYAFHDLVRAYAEQQAGTRDSEPGRRAALTRLFDYYLAAAGAAMDTLAPAERYRRPPVPPVATPLPRLDTPDAARAWLEAERVTLVAVAGTMAACGWPGHATRLSTTLFRYFRDIGGYYPEALAVHSHALRAARLSGDRAAQADAHMNRGMVDFRSGRHEQAVSDLEDALALYRELADRGSEARTLGNLGLVLWRQAEYPQSLHYHQQALALFRDLGDRFGQAIELDNLGLVLGRQGRYEQGADHHRQSLAIRRELGHRHGEARALGNLGIVLSWQGRGQEGAAHLELALAMFRDLGDRPGEADALNDLGTALGGQGQYEKAISYHQRARVMFREMELWSGEAEALNGAGEALIALGQPEPARAQHEKALTLARQIDDRYLQARAHHGLACTYHATGQLEDARRHWEHALVLYTALAVPEAARVRARLADLSPAAP